VPVPPPFREPLDLPLPDPDDRSARAASLRSRAAVQGRDRSAWLALFAPDAVVADPVGVSPLDPTGLGHRGPEARARFWDEVIAPNPIRMDVWSSAAGGREVANVMTITTTFPDGSSAAVDVVAVYRVDDDGLVESLRAFWEMEQMRFSPAPEG
jgi:ketosteroid isomerase-like protein